MKHPLEDGLLIREPQSSIERTMNSRKPTTELLCPLTEHGFRSPWFREQVPHFLGEFELSPMFPRFYEALQRVWNKVEQAQLSFRTLDTVQRSLAIGIALTQANQAPFSNPEDDPRIRGKETDPESGLNLAYMHHPLDCFEEYLRYGRREALLALAPIHDLIEDFRYRSGGVVMEKELLLAEIATEFADLPELPVLLQSVTIPEVTAEQREVILRSRLAKQIYQQVTRSRKPYTEEDIDNRIVKVGITFGQMFLVDRQATDDDEEYLDLARQSIAMKCIDGSKNMESGSTKKPSRVRNDILIRMARIMGWDMADTMMGQLIQIDPDDPFNPGASYRVLQTELGSDNTLETCVELSKLLQREGISCWIEPRYQISLQDESENTQCLQYYITILDSKDFERANSIIASIRKKDKTLRNAKRDGYVCTERVDGAVHDVMRFYKRKTMMYGLYGERGIEAYIRMVTADPFPVNSIYLPECARFVYPEDALFYLSPNATLEDVLEMVYKLYASSHDDFPFLDRSALV